MTPWWWECPYRREASFLDDVWLCHYNPICRGAERLERVPQRGHRCQTMTNCDHRMLVGQLLKEWTWRQFRKVTAIDKCPSALAAERVISERQVPMRPTKVRDQGQFPLAAHRPVAEHGVRENLRRPSFRASRADVSQEIAGYSLHHAVICLRSIARVLTASAFCSLPGQERFQSSYGFWAHFVGTDLERIRQLPGRRDHLCWAATLTAVCCQIQRLNVGISPTRMLEKRGAKCTRGGIRSRTIRLRQPGSVGTATPKRSGSACGLQQNANN